MDKEIVTELIQDDLNTKALNAELNKILSVSGRLEIIKNYDVLIEKLGGQGASKKAANLIVEQLKQLND